LRWADIDLENRFLEVNRSYYHRTKTYGPPKSKKTRKVDLTPVCTLYAPRGKKVAWLSEINKNGTFIAYIFDVRKE